jgi:hypothetical protein
MKPLVLVVENDAGTRKLVDTPLSRSGFEVALGAVPLMRGGAVIGAAGWSFREPRLFSEPEQQAFLGIAHEIAESLADEHHPTTSTPGSDQSASVAGA